MPMADRGEGSLLPAEVLARRASLPLKVALVTLEGAAVRLTEELVRRGHRRVAYVQFSERLDELERAHHSVRDRRDGYARVVSAAGLEPAFVGDRAELAHGSREEIVERVRVALAGPDRPTAADYRLPDPAAARAWLEGKAL